VNKPDTYEDVHVTLQNGKTVYWPQGDMARLAPAAVCNVASRIIWLRAWLRKLGPEALSGMTHDERRKLEHLINTPISFEKEFLSGKSFEVHNAIKTLGSQP